MSDKITPSLDFLGMLVLFLGCLLILTGTASMFMFPSFLGLVVILGGIGITGLAMVAAKLIFTHVVTHRENSIDFVA